MEGEIFWAFLILGTMSTMVSRPILKNPFTFAYKFYNIELGVANYTGVASHGWLTIRWSRLLCLGQSYLYVKLIDISQISSTFLQ